MPVTKNEQTLNILTHTTVRNPNITANDFVLILYLKYMIWKLNNKYILEVSSDDMKRWTGLSDKMLKKSLHNLFAQNYLLNEVGKRTPNKPVLLTINKENFDSENRRDGEYFSSMPIKLLYALKDGKLNPKEVRFLYYLKSYINVKNKAKLFCYAGIDTRMKNELHMSKPTIIELHSELEKKKLISVTQHKWGTNYEYDDNDKLIHKRFNNHYFIEFENIDKL
ncbi:hypothetical protein NST41_22915 [Paenibacillus sp. FSL L8-0696]|uniref:hypothetical protein n=1 Tax=unclassified Paenibacillus TaxID=185978 RepID=UPI0030D06510